MSRREATAEPEHSTGRASRTPLEDLSQDQESPVLAGGSPRDRTASFAPDRQLLVGECIDPMHPTLRGRVRVRWEDGGTDTRTRWLPTLYRLPVREGDRVLLASVANWDERVVIGVLDGFARRPERERQEAAGLELKPDESLRVRAEDGTELLEVHQGDRGPVVRLLQGDVDLELPGALRLRADEVALEARRGNLELRSTDDVVVRGEVIRLN